nr:hypothetical protein [Tanacetum cinerariifolium]
KARKKQKRKVVRDASGSTYPPKKLRDDHRSLLPKTGGKSLGAMEPLIAASVAPVLDVGPLDSMSGPNLQTCPPHMRYVVSSYGLGIQVYILRPILFVRSPTADASVVTVAVTTTIDADVAAGSKAKDVSNDFKNIGDFMSAGGVNADATSISRLKKTSTSSDSFYASQSLDTKTMHHVYIPRWKVTNDSTLDDPYVCRDLTDRLAPQVCLGVEVRMWAKHNLERKCKLEDKCDEHTTLLSEKDAEIAHLKSLLSLKETEAAEAISLQSQIFALGRAIGCAVNKGIQDGLKAGNDHGKVRRDLSVVEAYDPSAEEKYVDAINALGAIDFSLLSELVSKKDSSIIDLIYSLCLEGALAEIL